jgi:single-stranded DNA-specific DHH superfamily exonuclease
VGILDTALDAFIEYSNRNLANFNFTSKYNIDFEYDTHTLTAQDILNLAEYKGLWGQGVEEPYVLIKNIRLTANNLCLLKESTIKIMLEDDISLIKFGSSREEYENLYSDLGCVTINIIGRFQKNTWGGKTSPQILIEDYEIVGRAAYYF